MNRLETAIMLLSFCQFLETKAVIVEPPNSIYNACPGDMIVVICKITDQILTWTWQNETIQMEQYTFYGIETTDQMLSINYSFPGVPGVAVTLLNITGGTSSSLQFTVSTEFERARISCNNDYRDIIVQTNFSTNITSSNISQVSGTNYSSIILVWNKPTGVRSTFINVTANTESLTLLTSKSSVELHLKNGIEYSISVYTPCCGSTCIIGSIKLIPFECNTLCHTFENGVIIPTTEIIESYELPDTHITTTYDGVAGVSVPISAFVGTVIGLFMLILIAGLSCGILGWKFRSCYEHKHRKRVKSKNNIETDTLQVNLETTKESDTPIYDDIKAENEQEIDTLKNVAYGHISVFATNK